jgi:hypothetical protein
MAETSLVSNSFLSSCLVKHFPQCDRTSTVVDFFPGAPNFSHDVDGVSCSAIALTRCVVLQVRVWFVARDSDREGDSRVWLILMRSRSCAQVDRAPYGIRGLRPG